MSLGQFIFVFSSPGNFLADSNVHVDGSTVESVVLHMVDPFLSVVWEMLRVWREGKSMKVSQWKVF